MSNELKVGDWVKPNHKTLKKASIHIQVDNSPWEVTQVYGSIITFNRISRKTGHKYFDRFHRDFLIKVALDGNKATVEAPK